MMSWEILRSRSEPSVPSSALHLPSRCLPHHKVKRTWGSFAHSICHQSDLLIQNEFRMRLGAPWGLFFVTSLAPLIFGSQLGLIIGVRGNSRFWGMVHTQVRQEIWEFFRWSHSWLFKWPFKTGGPWYGSSYAYTHYQGGTAGTMEAEKEETPSKSMEFPWIVENQNQVH